jgi:hypothetical protein
MCSKRLSHLHASSKLIAPLQPCADTTASLLPVHSSCLSNSTTHSWCQSVVRGMSSILICVTPGATVRHSLHFTKGFHVKQCAVMPCLFKSRHLEQQLLLSRMLRFGIDAAWDAERYTSVPFQGRLPVAATRATHLFKHHQSRQHSHSIAVHSPPHLPTAQQTPSTAGHVRYSLFVSEQRCWCHSGTAIKAQCASNVPARMADHDVCDCFSHHAACMRLMRGCGKVAAHAGPCTATLPASLRLTLLTARPSRKMSACSGALGMQTSSLMSTASFCRDIQQTTKLHCTATSTGKELCG